MKYLVGPAKTLTGLPVWVVCGSDTGVRWHSIRVCSERDEAEEICWLLSTGAITVDQAPEWRALQPVIGERVETVADIHRGLRRRR